MGGQIRHRHIGNALSGLLAQNHGPGVHDLLNPVGFQGHLEISDRSPQPLNRGFAEIVNVGMDQDFGQGLVGTSEKKDFHACLGKRHGAFKGCFRISDHGRREIIGPGRRRKGFQPECPVNGSLDKPFKTLFSQRRVGFQEPQHLAAQIAGFHHGAADAGSGKKRVLEPASLVRTGAADKIQRAADAGSQNHAGEPLFADGADQRRRPFRRAGRGQDFGMFDMGLTAESGDIIA